jgi:hypothetical protein
MNVVVNVAVMARSTDIEIMQLPVPVHGADQPVKVEPLSAAAVIVTAVLIA